MNTESDKLISEAIASLAVKVHAYKSKYGNKCVVVTGCGTECGTTMVATNLAVALSGCGYETLLVDADLRARRKDKNRVASEGLCDLLCQENGYDMYVKFTNVDKLSFMPSGSHAESPSLLFCSVKMSNFIKKASESYEFIVIDCPAVTVVPDAVALFSIVDGIILVCALDKTSKKQLRASKNIIEPYGDKYYGLVVNSVPKWQAKLL